MQRVRLQEDEELEDELMEADDLELMTANLLKIKREITDRNEQEQPNAGHDNQAKWISERANNRELVEEIRDTYNEFLSSHTLPSNHEAKLNVLLDNEELSIGSILALFEMVFYFREAISEEVLQEISEKAFAQLQNQERSQAEQCCLMELLAVCGVYEERIINFVVENMLENKIDFTLSFLVLSNMGYGGLAALVHLARLDFKQLPIMILDHLSRTEEVITQLLIPTLVQDLLAAKTKGKEKEIILAILNRLNHLTSTANASIRLYPTLIQLMQNGNADKGFIASVLRSSGLEGEKILLQFMSQMPQNQKIMLPIISVMPWRVPADPVLRIKVIEYTLGSNFLPGTLYQYEGSLEPSAFCFEEEECCDSLCINARDFVACLQRLLSQKSDNFENEEPMRKGAPNNIKMFTLYQVIGKKEESEDAQISDDIIRALIKSLKSPKPDIREAALNSLGLIGLPESYEAIEEISKCLWDKESKNRSMACWALSKICEQPSRRIINRLIELLKDNFWKVRISACICIGSIIREPLEPVIQALVKCLRDSSVNKVTVCETIIKLGTIGEEVLLQILKNTSANDFKLKQAIIYSLKQADVKVSSIDYVLEEIFKHCKGTRVETRAACLETLNNLRVKASEQGEQIVYLKAKSILPFYYYFLEDPAANIRQMAAEAIFSFGGQAELIFIEGMTKGNPMVRVESAKGLARLGIQNFRALILGLRDDDISVRKTASTVILNSFTPEDVASYYFKKPQQIPSLLCNLKDILLSGGLAPATRSFVKETIHYLEKYSENVNANHPDFSAIAQGSRLKL